MNGIYNCPICGSPGEPSPRYPKYVCLECASKASDENGRPLQFYNESFSGGFIAVYGDTGEPYGKHVCFVEGRPCWAQEAHMGGIVVSTYDGPISSK